MITIYYLQIKQEFRRLTGRDAEEGLDAFLEKKTEELYKLFLMKAASKKQAKQILEYSRGCSLEESASKCRKKIAFPSGMFLEAF